MKSDSNQIPGHACWRKFTHKFTAYSQSEKQADKSEMKEVKMLCVRVNFVIESLKENNASHLYVL